MATTDANGQVFYGPSDPIEPIQALFNGISTAVSTRIGTEAQRVRIANVAGRAAAVTARAGRPITAADPLVVWRADAPAGSYEEYTIDGTNWFPLVGAPIYARSRSTALDYTATVAAIDFPNTEINAPTFTYASGGTFTCVIPGVYCIEARGNINASGIAARFELALIVNGSVSESSPGMSSTTGGVSNNIIRTLRFNAGDTFYLRSYSNIAIGASIGGQNCRVQATRLGN